MIDYKYILLGAMGLGLIMDILGEGLMSIGIFLGWLIGMMTITQWEIERKSKKQ